MQKAYGNEAQNRSNVFKCYSQFRDERELVENDEKGGRPKSNGTEVNIAGVADLVKNDRRIASGMLAESMNTPSCSSSDSDWGTRKLCTRFVPHSSTPEQREDRVTSCQDIIAMAYADESFFNKLITGDETWCFAYDPKQCDRVLNELVRHLLGRRNWNSKGPAIRIY